jgi:hypothetical protein
LIPGIPWKSATPQNTACTGINAYKNSTIRIEKGIVSEIVNIH